MGKQYSRFPLEREPGMAGVKTRLKLGDMLPVMIDDAED
jgi:hypothetical protein